MNLLNNAYDAVLNLPERWVRLSVEDKGDCVVFAVTDSGQRIPDAIASKIMHPFFTTKGIGQGTGLGLSISRGIVESHGG
ncbi:sensor histidine kinase, partial [Klebsiella pneumoniae]